MDLTSFTKLVQTFGAAPERWNTPEHEAALQLAGTPQGADLLKQEKRLDDKLDLFQAPSCDKLCERLYASIINDKSQRLIFLFLRQATWISLLFMIGGFYFGWYQTHEDYVNTTSYFNQMFDETIY